MLKLNQVVKVKGSSHPWKVAEIRKDYILVEHPTNDEKFLFITDPSIIVEVA